MPTRFTRRTAGIALGLAWILAALPAPPVLSRGEHFGAGGRAAVRAARIPSGSPLLRTVRVGTNPFALAVDEPTARVFAVNFGPVKNGSFPAGPGSVSVLDATSGTVLRTTPIRAGPLSALVDARTTRVFILHNDTSVNYTRAGSVSVLDAATGKVLRTVPVSGAPAAGAVDARTGRVFVAMWVSIGVLDATSGRVLRTIRARGDGLAVDERLGRLFVADGFGMGACTNYCVGVLDATTGAVLSGIGVSQAVEAIAVDERTGHVVADLSPGRGDTSWVSLLDAATGAVLNTVTISAYSNSTIAVDPRTSRAFIVNTPGAYEAESNGGLCTVNVIDTRSGRVVNAITVGASGGPLEAAVAIDERTNRAFVTTQVEQITRNGHLPYFDAPVGPGHMSVFDARSGRLLRTLRLGRGEHPVAVDERTARVFVANEIDGTVSVFDATRL